MRLIRKTFIFIFAQVLILRSIGLTCLSSVYSVATETLRPFSIFNGKGQKQELKQTVLYDEHIKDGAKMGEFAGYEMPMFYTDPSEENLNTRRNVSAFDISHMGLIDIKGNSVSEFVDWIASPNQEKDGSVRPLRVGDIQYRVMLDDEANNKDDIEVIKLAENHIRLVVNAANTERVYNWLNLKVKGGLNAGKKAFDCEIIDLRNAPNAKDSRIILALQGTVGVQALLQRLTDYDLNKLEYFKFICTDLIVDGEKIENCLIQRTGYTGEDGFEIHLPPDKAIMFWKKAKAIGARPAGLIARNSLRVEAGLSLFGHELGDGAEDGPMIFENDRFSFVLALDSDVDFIGKSVAIEKRKNSTKKIVGIKILGGASVPQQKDKVFNINGEEIGYVTSGVSSPTLNSPIGFVYIDKEYAKIETPLTIEIGGQKVLAKVAETPFINNIISDRVNEKEKALYYIPSNDEESAKKLAVIKEVFPHINSVEDLFGTLQEYFYKGDFNLPTAISRRELYCLLDAISTENRADLLSFRGAGYYFEPGSDLADYARSRKGIYTPYTPYQPEVSQGTLRFMFAYQSLMANLLNMDVVNASLYDGATALAEGAHMASHIMDKNTIIVVGAINPFHKEVLRTYMDNAKLKILEIKPDKKTGRIDIEALKGAIDNDTASIVIQQPNFLGQLETEIHKITSIAKEKNILLHIHSNDPTAFVKVKAPGSYGADIATGEGQALMGGGPYYGGNNLGIIACKRKFVTYLPGRLSGQTQDAEGNIRFALSLTHREQHVALDKALSNICTSATLNATSVAVNTLDKGEGGLKQIADNSHRLASEFAREIQKIKGFHIFGFGPIFREVLVYSAIPIDKLQEGLLKRGIDAGFDISKYFPELGNNLIQFSFTGVHTPTDVQKLLDALKEIAEEAGVKQIEHAPIALTEIPEGMKRDTSLNIPNISGTVLRDAIKELADSNYNPVDNPEPLGSCTVMHNPEVNEKIAGLPGYSQLHPYGPTKLSQGTLKILYELGLYMNEITGMDGTSISPLAGAQGELTGLTAIFRYHRANNDTKRNIVITTDSAHGTNLASSTMASAKVERVETDKKTGRLNLDSLKAVLEKYKGEVSAIMLTEPNTLGLFEDLKEAGRLVHEAGGMVYMDGANLNAILGWIRPGDLNVDVLQVNPHKTLSGPHGGGGPGAGFVCVKEKLAKFLPNPRVVKLADGTYGLDYDSYKDGIRIGTFIGNIPVAIRAYAYLRALGKEGLREVSGEAVINANYLLARLLKAGFDVPYAEGETRMHEFVVSIQKIKEETGVSAMDFAKMLQDFGIHPPTVYFPHIIEEAMMFEPTQSMTIKELDRIADAMIKIKEMAYKDPDYVKTAPHTIEGGRINVAQAQQLDVILKTDNIAAVLNIGKGQLSTEKLQVIPTAHPYEPPFDDYDWEGDPKRDSCKFIDSGEYYDIVQLNGKTFAVVGLTENSIELFNHSVKSVIPLKIGSKVKEGEPCTVVTSEKSPADVYCPVTGTVVKVNKILSEDATYLNKEPYGKGWLFVVELTEEPSGRLIIPKDLDVSLDVLSGRIPVANLGIAHVTNDTQGIIQITANRGTRKILSVDVPKGASYQKEFDRFIALAKSLDVTIEDLADLTIAHPTMPELLGEAAEDALGMAIHQFPEAPRAIPSEQALYDLLIVGSGPAGYVAAIRASQLGLKVAVVEKEGYYGGTCLNRGCIPTKVILKYIEEENAKGVNKIELSKIRERVDSVVKGLSTGIDKLLNANGVRVIKGEFNMKDAERTEGEGHPWNIKINDNVYTAKNLILATGSKPTALKGINTSQKKVMNSNDALELKAVPDELTIIGAGPIGLEFARIFNALGAKVTVVEKEEQILPGVLDEDMAKRLQREMEKQDIKFQLGTGFDFNKDSSGTILVAIGRTPNTEGMEGYVTLTAKGEVVVNDLYQASRNLYAVGDIIAMKKEGEIIKLPQLANAASAEAKRAVQNIAKPNVNAVLDYNQVPGVVFTHPIIASVGLTEKAAKDEDRDITIRYLSYPDGRTLVKAVLKKGTGTVLGFQVIGPVAPYAIAQMTLVIKKQVGLDEFRIHNGLQVVPPNLDMRYLPRFLEVSRLINSYI